MESKEPIAASESPAPKSDCAESGATMPDVSPSAITVSTSPTAIDGNMTVNQFSRLDERPTEPPIPADVSSDVFEAGEGSGIAHASDSATTQAHQPLAARDPSDARYETVQDPRMPPDQMYFKIGEVSR